MMETKELNKHWAMLIVEDDQALRDSCVRLFERHQCRTIGVSSGREALTRLDQTPDIGVVLADLKMPGMDGIELLQAIRDAHPLVEVIIMTAYGTIKTAVEAVKLGAFDYITKPFDPEELVRIAARAQEVVDLRAKVQSLTQEVRQARGAANLLGACARMQEVFEKIKVAARSCSSVLIHGETGTGKELVARAIHESSDRHRGPFVPLNCAALPRELVDRELFGHTKGAFTGADRDQPGLFQEASQGILFLDEIAEMPLEGQAKLLRAIQEGRIRPLGSTKEIEVRPRIIAATNWNPAAALEGGRLRKDLYYRLDVIDIHVPPLRERQEDLPFLCHHFIQRACKKLNKEIMGLESRALDLLVSYSWPGNVRELENLLEGLVAATTQGQIGRSAVKALIQPRGAGISESRLPEGRAVTLDEMARSLAIETVQKAAGNKSKAAQILGISRKKLYSLLADSRP